MATFLKYENGLLIPVQNEKSNGARNTNDQLADTSSNNRDRINASYRKIYNLLIMLTVIVNTLLTVAAVANHS